MKAFLICIAVASIFAFSGFFFLHQQKPTSTISGFQDWAKKQNRDYSSVDEYKLREQLFSKNLEKINNHNSKTDKTYTMAPNQFMDLSFEEWKAYYLNGLLLEPSPNPDQLTEKSNSKRPDEFDWRKQPGNVIRKIKDQEQCGSCWAFSATGALEGLATIKKGLHDDYSEQQLVDCSKAYGNEGCNGGLMTWAFQQVIDKGITTEKDYPQVARDQKCKKDGGTFKISSFKDLPKGDVEILADTVLTQPISVGVEATNWTFYHWGLFSDCGADINHGVLIVGYHPWNWYVKNSWGDQWGENGYIRLRRGNTCGVADMATIPIVQ